MSRKKTEKTGAVAPVKESQAHLALEIQSALVCALNARIEHARVSLLTSLEEKLARIQREFGQETFVPVIESLLSLDYDFASLTANLAVSDRLDRNHIAVYAIQKMVRIMRALSSQSSGLIDAYTTSIVKNLLAHNALTFQECLRSLTITLRDSQKKIVRYHSCGLTTATTQSSSTKSALVALCLVTATKSKRDDTITLVSSKMSDRLRSLYQTGATQ